MKLKDLTKILKMKNLVEFPYTGYFHWGVFTWESSLPRAGLSRDTPEDVVGDMVHLTSVDSKVVLEYVKYQDAMLGRKNNIHDDEKPPKDPEVISRDTLNMVGTEGYNLARYNCEHFAMECRYWDAESQQIEDLKEIFEEATADLGGVAGLVTGVASTYFTQTSNRLPTKFSDIVKKADENAFNELDYKESPRGKV